MMDKSPLEQKLDQIEEQISALQTERLELIAHEETHFNYLRKRPWDRERYLMVYGDGSRYRGFPDAYQQRPSALRQARIIEGVYVWDTRDGSIRNAKDEVIGLAPKHLQ